MIPVKNFQRAAPLDSQIEDSFIPPADGITVVNTIRLSTANFQIVLLVDLLVIGHISY